MSISLSSSSVARIASRPEPRVDGGSGAGAPAAVELTADARVFVDLPTPLDDGGLHEALRGTTERHLLDLTQRATYAQRVREFLVHKGGPHHTDMDEAARAIGLSVRSLRRRLNAEGNSYHVVANEALKLVAKHLLLSKQHTIQETAYEMGFADARSFHRAFRRWTGTTPGAYRRAQRHQEAPAQEAPGE